MSFLTRNYHILLPLGICVLLIIISHLMFNGLS